MVRKNSPVIGLLRQEGDKSTAESYSHQWVQATHSPLLAAMIPTRVRGMVVFAACGVHGFFTNFQGGGSLSMQLWLEPGEVFLCLLPRACSRTTSDRLIKCHHILNYPKGGTDI